MLDKSAGRAREVVREGPDSGRGRPGSSAGLHAKAQWGAPGTGGELRSGPVCTGRMTRGQGLAVLSKLSTQFEPNTNESKNACDRLQTARQKEALSSDCTRTGQQKVYLKRSEKLISQT